MRKILILGILLFASSSSMANGEIDELIRIDHSWVQGSYWNPEVLPNWGFLVDVQEETMFGSLYGYQDNKPTFVVFVGAASSTAPIKYEGEVFLVTNPGVSEEVVGNFSWTVTQKNAAPSALLNITSHILNIEDLELNRFGFGDVDKIDMLTGGDWNIIRRPGSSTYADHYAITDERTIEEDVTYATVVDLANPDANGVVGYFPSEDGDYYSMMMEYTESAKVFYLFYANHTGMYGRYWLLEEGDQLSGDGSYFRAVVDNLQKPGNTAEIAVEKGTTSVSSTPNTMTVNSVAQAELRQMEFSDFEDANDDILAALTPQSVTNIFQRIKTRLKSGQN